MPDSYFQHQQKHLQSEKHTTLSNLTSYINISDYLFCPECLRRHFYRDLRWEQGATQQ
jgi:hypothetical protein